MSRYSTRSLDVGSSSRYDTGGSSSSSSSSYKGLDSSSSGLGSYRSSNLSSYGGSSSHYSSGGRSSDRGYSGSSSGVGSSSSRLHHHGSSSSSSSYSSRSSAMDSVPLPRSSSFGRSEVLSSSTPRDQVGDKGGYSSSLGRSSSIPVHSEAGGSSRYSSRSSALSTNHSSLDSGSDAAAERRLRLAERRRLREERGLSETSSDTSKEPSVERGSSLRRDSSELSDLTDSALSAARSRRLASRLQEASLLEEPSSKDSSPDISDAAGFRRSSRRLRGSSGSSEDTTTSAADTATSHGAERRSSLRQRRLQEAAESSERGSVDGGADTERLSQLSAEARRARRQRRLEGLEAASKTATTTEPQENEDSSDKTSSSLTSTASSSRSWRQRLQEEGVSGVSVGDSGDTTRKTRAALRAQEDEEEDHQKQKSDTQSEVSGRRKDRGEAGEEEADKRRPSWQALVTKDTVEEQSKVADTVAAEVESRAERIARYKEERRKQLAHIASITSSPTAAPSSSSTSSTKTEDKDKEGGDAALPSLFISAKRDKEDSPSPPDNSAGAPSSASRDDGSGGGVSLTSRLRALRSGSGEPDREDSPPISRKPEDPDSSAKESADQAGSSLSQRQATSTSRSSPPSDLPSAQVSRKPSSLSEPPGQQKKSSSVTTPSTETTASGRKQSSSSFREPTPRKTSSSSSSDVRSDRKPSTDVSRKSKSPSPATSRLMSPTKSSAAKGHHQPAPGQGASPRSSVSPRASPASTDRLNISRSASDASGTKGGGTRGTPRVRPSVVTEHGAKEAPASASSSHVSKSSSAAARDGEGADLPRHQRSKVSPPHRHTGAESSSSSSIPKLSSSSSTTTHSTDRDSGVGSTSSSRLSSSSFSSSITRSQDKDTASSASKASRLQRTARVELSSSSSREGSEEKQLPTVDKPAHQRVSMQSSVKRTTSLPARPEGQQQDKTSVGGSVSGSRQSSRSQQAGGKEKERGAGDRVTKTKLRTGSSSSPEKELSPPPHHHPPASISLPLSQKSGRESRKGEDVAASSPVARSGRSGHLATVKEVTTPTSSSTPESAQSSKAASAEPLSPLSPLKVPPGVVSPSGNTSVALDDLLAKNAEFLGSEGEEEEGASSGSGSRTERRSLRHGEEPKLRRSLRKKASLRSSGRSRKSPESDSKDSSQEQHQQKGRGEEEKEREEGEEGEQQMEAVEAPPTPTLTLPTTSTHSLVPEGAVLRISGPPPPQPPPSSSSTSSTTTTSKAKESRDVPGTSLGPSSSFSAADGDRGGDGDRAEERHTESRWRGGGVRAKGGGGGIGEEGGLGGGGREGGTRDGVGVRSGSGSKEATPESDSVFHTASSSPSPSLSPDLTARRRPLPDKSLLRKSSLNKASDEPGAASHSTGHDTGGRKGEEEVSDIRSRFSGGGGSTDSKARSSEGGGGSGSARSTTGVARHPSRAKEFSQLLSKFSSSEASSSERSDSESASHQPRRVASFRRPADRDTGSGSSGDDSARTRAAKNVPARTQSMKVVRASTTSGDHQAEEEEEQQQQRKTERSSSFKSDFMKKRFSPVPQGEAAPSEELSEVLSRRQKEVDEQQKQQGVTDSVMIADKRTAQAERFKASDIEEVIADSEVASVLRARRKKSESPAPDSDSGPQTTVSGTGSSSRKDSELSVISSDVTVDTWTSVSLTAAADSDSSSSSSRKGHQHHHHHPSPCTATKEPSPSPSSTARSPSPLTTSFTLTLNEKTESNNSSSSSSSTSKTTTTSAAVKQADSRLHDDDGSTKSVVSESTLLVSSASVSSSTVVQKERDVGGRRSAERETTPTTSATITTTSSTTSSSTSLRRTESMKQPSLTSESVEKRRGILKRTPSLPKQPESGPIIDPQLMKIMEQRRLRELEESQKAAREKDEEEEEEEISVPLGRPRALSAAEEIEENIRHMRQSQQARGAGGGGTGVESEEEAALYKPVADRIFQMQSRLEEAKYTPHTPKSRSGAATPKSARSWSSGSITPRKQASVDEGVVAEIISEETTTTPTSSATPTTTTTITSGPDPTTLQQQQQEKEEEERSTGEQLMERLSSLAASEAQFQERRHKFQKRHREDWRTRTQPVTMEEIQEADSLDTVSAFRAQVRRNASKSIFEQLKTQGQQGSQPGGSHKPLPPGKGSEFPQHLVPEKRGQRRGRHQRHKTLPVTAEELKAIPEGEPSEPSPLMPRDTQAMWKRDSRTDSGILSGSEADSDSLRSLTLEMDLSENDPSRMSVSSKTSLFKSLDERARQEREKEKSASGAKRYIDRKKRERSRTQPVTDDEVQTAAEMSTTSSSSTAEDNSRKPASSQSGPPPASRLPQPEVVNRPKSPSVEEEAEPEEDDQLTKLSLAEKVKLFSQKKEQQEAAAKAQTRAEAPVPKRRQRKFNSRFNTQPVTPEEVEKASKISPLAMSLVKPPDPELLMGLKLKDQQELMMLHAEATLAHISSPRPASRSSSQAGSPPRRGSFAAPSSQDTADVTKPQGTSEPETVTTSTTTTTTMVKKSSSQEGEPRSILKKAKSIETVHPMDHPFSTTTPRDKEEEEEEAGERDGDRASPVAELILPQGDWDASREHEESPRPAFFLADENFGGESSTDPVSVSASVEREEEDVEEEEEGARSAEDGNRKTRKGPAERYLTQPMPQLTPERSPQSKRKYEGRHMTQPITPDEMKEAEFSTTPKSGGGSIADRLNQLKTSGEENWKKKVVKDKDLSTPVTNLKREEGGGGGGGRGLATRPVSISDRLSKLEVSAEQWRDKVEETDAVKFTVANKLQKSVVGSESPLVAKIKASSKKDLTRLDDSSNASSPVNSPSTPTKEFLPKVPLPKEIVADPVAAAAAAAKKAESKKEGGGRQVNGGEEEEEGGRAVKVEVPSLGEEELDQFFSVKEITEITDKVDMDVDDFNDIFIESSEILPSVKKIRPTRRKKATSRNPLKTVSQFVEIQTEYTQVSTGVAEKFQRQMKRDALKQDAGLAVEALAALASTENFGKIELRTTETSTLPGTLAARRNPFSDLMLLHVKGRRNIQTRLVEPSSRSMNSGDCYILVTPDKVINWVGEFSNIIEKAKSADVANYIQQKRDMCYKGTGAVQTVDQVKDHLGAGKQFWGVLSHEKQCQACGPEEEDELYESSIVKTNMVYRLEDGALKPYEKYWGTIPKYSMLDRKELLVFDFGAELYVWHGKELSPPQRKQGMELAQRLWDKGYDYSQCAVNPMGPLRAEDDGVPVQAPQRPSWAIFGKVNQNMETILFREKFADWPDSSRLIGVKREKSTEMKSELADIQAYDAKKMIPINTAPVTLLLEGAHVGRGKKWQEDMQGFVKEQDILTLGIKVWHVMEYEHYTMPQASYGHFHNGDTYVVRWQYMITNAGLKSLKGQAARHSLTGRERCAYFFWQGQDSTINEKGASALMTVELDEERGPQVRVVQGKEPPCFLNLFEGGMVVHIGKREDASTNTSGPWRLYCLRGDQGGELCLLELPVSICNLRSRSSLLLLNTRTGMCCLWHGAKSPPHLRQLALAAANNLREKRPLELDLHADAHIIIREVEEGEEKGDVWAALDSKDRSLYHSLLNDPLSYDYTPRLFHMSSVSMVFEVIEQMNPARLPEVTTPFPFFQSDLYKASQPALFLLDVGRCVYLWQGWWPVGDEDVENVQTGSAAARYNVDRRCAMETTLNYCKERAGRRKPLEAYLVYAGVEPLDFQNLFPFWEVDPTVHSLALQEGRKEGCCERVEEVYVKLTQTRYTMDRLLERPLPDGVDPLKLESYLVDQEFEEVLEMSREEFYKQPSWKQKEMKKTVGLY